MSCGPAATTSLRSACTGQNCKMSRGYSSGTFVSPALRDGTPSPTREGPADYVTQAIDILAVERIDHGVRAEEDAALLERLAAERLPLTVCPLSNVSLGIFARLEEHNVARLLRRGVAVSLHSDDPPYFGGYLSHCFEQTATALGLSPVEVVELNKNAIRAAFVDRGTKQRLLAASDAILREVME